MINEKIMDIRKQRIMKHTAILDEKMRKVQEIHDAEGKSDTWKAALAEAIEIRDYGFSVLRGHGVSNPTESPSDSGYWLDVPRHEYELTNSAITETLKDVDADKLRNLVAELILFNRGMIDSTIDNIKAYQKDNGTIKITTVDKCFNTSEFLDYLRYCPDENGEYHSGSPRRTIRRSLRQTLLTIEDINATAMSKRQIPGGNWERTNSAKKKSAQKWLINAWNNGRYASHDTFIMRMKETAPPEVCATMTNLFTDDEIKSFLPTKKKNNR